MLAAPLEKLTSIRTGSFPEWFQRVALNTFGTVQTGTINDVCSKWPTARLWMHTAGALEYGESEHGHEQALVALLKDCTKSWHFDRHTVAEFAGLLGCRFEIDDLGPRDGYIRRVVALFAPGSVRGEPGTITEGPPWLCAHATAGAARWFRDLADARIEGDWILRTFIDSAGRAEKLRNLHATLVDRFPDVWHDDSELSTCFSTIESGNSYAWNWRGLAAEQAPILLLQRSRDGSGSLYYRDFEDSELNAAARFARAFGCHSSLVRRPMGAQGSPQRVRSLLGVAFTPVPLR